MPSLLEQLPQSRHDSRTRRLASHSRPREILDLGECLFRGENDPGPLASHPVLCSLEPVVSESNFQ